MGKIKKGLVENVKKEIEFKEDQKKLKKIYSISDQNNVVVVEKTNAYKFTVKTIISIIKTGATVVLLTLAVIGLTTLIYPTIRHEFFMIGQNIYEQFQTLISR